MNSIISLLFIILADLGHIGPKYVVAGKNGTEPDNRDRCPVSLKSLASDPSAQSSVSSLLVPSSVDSSVEYLCSAGSSYDPTGITCYALKCPAPIPYGGSGQYGPGRQAYQDSYGRPAYAQSPISVGAQVSYVETAYPCWKLKLVRLNTYVYITCFVHNYASLMFQVVFKDNGQLELVHYDTISSNQLTSVGRSSFTAENMYLCMAAVYSSFATPKGDDFIRLPSDLLAPIYYICPNNYKWYFCGNVDVENTIDVSVWYAHNTLYAIFVQVRTVSPAPYYAGFAANKEEYLKLMAKGIGIHEPYKITPLLKFTIAVDIETYVCSSKPDKNVPEILAIGIAPSEPVTLPLDDDALNYYYELCGVRKCTIAITNDMTALCCAVSVDPKNGCPRPGLLHTVLAPQYSSFCIPYNTATKTFDTDKVVFLEKSDKAVEVTFINTYKGSDDCCQWVITASPAGSMKIYSFGAIAAALDNQTAPTSVAPVPSTKFNDEKLFHNAVACSFKTKCCGGQDTCVTCTRPTRYGDKYLASLNCGSGRADYSRERGEYGSGGPPRPGAGGVTFDEGQAQAPVLQQYPVQQQPGYAVNPTPIQYGRYPSVGNYSNPVGGPYGPQLQPMPMPLHTQQMLPPGPGYGQLPLQQQQLPQYGVRYN